MIMAILTVSYVRFQQLNNTSGIARVIYLTQYYFISLNIFYEKKQGLKLVFLSIPEIVSVLSTSG